MSKLLKILAIDGGGIRGIIPAIILAEIERRAGQPISRLFDLIAGSSTGSMLAVGLATPDKQQNPRYSAEELARFYEEEGAIIFSRSRWRAIQSLNNITTVKYSSDGIDSVLDKVFGDLNLSDAIANVLITSYEIQQRKPWFFRSRKAKVATKCDFKLRDVVRASTAAPTFFEPAQVFHAESEDDDYFALIDGSMQANNPALCAYVDAKNKHPEAEEYLVLSLGTGDATQRIDYEEARLWGIAGWSQHILSIAFDAMSSTVDYQMRHLIPKCRDGIQHYYRFQTRLDDASDELDNFSPRNIDALKCLANNILDKEDAQIDRLIQKILV